MLDSFSLINRGQVFLLLCMNIHSHDQCRKLIFLTMSPHGKVYSPCHCPLLPVSLFAL